MVARPKIDRQVMRAHNRAVVLDAVRRSGPLARTEVARRTSLAKPTVSAIVDDLLTEGLVHEVGVGKSTAAGGRPPTYLDFDVTRDAYVGVHVGVDETTVAVADGRGTSSPRAAADRRSDRRRARSEHVRRAARRRAGGGEGAREDGPPRDASCSRDWSIARPACACSRRTSAGRTCPSPSCSATRSACRSTVWNTPHASAFAEASSRRGARRRHVRVALRGSRRRQRDRAGRRARRRARAASPARSDTAAIADDGPQCHCGKYGCLEVYTSAEALGRAARRRRRAVAHARRHASPTSCAPRATATRARSGCSTTPATCSAWARRTSSASSTRELVVVGGESAEAFEFLLEPLRGASRPGRAGGRAGAGGRERHRR